MEPTPYVERLIKRTVVPMFRAPDPLSEQVSQALLGTCVRECGGRGDWRLIQTPDGYQGWIATAALADIPARWRGPWVEVTDLFANFRARNDSQLAALMQATIGVRLPLLGTDGGWTEVGLPDGRVAWTESHRVQVVEQDPLRPARAAAVCRTARRFLRVPYLWGGCSPVGLDCSGFAQLVMRLHGIHLQRDAAEQAEQGRPAETPSAADLVFFGPEAEPERITHVAMMLDGERFIHAAGSDCVRINRLSDVPYHRQLRFARRYLG